MTVNPAAAAANSGQHNMLKGMQVEKHIEPPVSTVFRQCVRMLRDHSNANGCQLFFDELIIAPRVIARLARKKSHHPAKSDKSVISLPQWLLRFFGVDRDVDVLLV